MAITRIMLPALDAGDLLLEVQLPVVKFQLSFGTVHHWQSMVVSLMSTSLWHTYMYGTITGFLALQSCRTTLHMHLYSKHSQVYTTSQFIFVLPI